jgi:hypothetical protein
MTGVIEPATYEYDVTLRPVRGFGSETFLYNIAEEWKQIKKPIRVYYLGDHDPSGFSIEENIKKRLIEFSGRLHTNQFDTDWMKRMGGGWLRWTRLAVAHRRFL